MAVVYSTMKAASRMAEIEKERPEMSEAEMTREIFDLFFQVGRMHLDSRVRLVCKAVFEDWRITPKSILIKQAEAMQALGKLYLSTQ